MFCLYTYILYNLFIKHIYVYGLSEARITAQWQSEKKNGKDSVHHAGLHRLDLLPNCAWLAGVLGKGAPNPKP